MEVVSGERTLLEAPFLSSLEAFSKVELRDDHRSAIHLFQAADGRLRVQVLIKSSLKSGSLLRSLDQDSRLGQWAPINGESGNTAGGGEHFSVWMGGAHGEGFHIGCPRHQHAVLFDVDDARTVMCATPVQMGS